MVAPWQETAIKVVIEFKKSNKGVQRQILLSHTKDVLPQQLYGRVTPEVWRDFMVEVEALAGYHPYTTRPDAGQCCMNIQGLMCWLCIGFGIFNPDGGNYRVWTREVNDCIAHHQPKFSPGGCNLSLQAVHGGFWIQIDINPNVAVGYAVGAPQDAAAKPSSSMGMMQPLPPPQGYPATPPGYPSAGQYAQAPQGYPGAQPSYQPPGAYPPQSAYPPPQDSYAYPPPKQV